MLSWANQSSAFKGSVNSVSRGKIMVRGLVASPRFNGLCERSHHSPLCARRIGLYVEGGHWNRTDMITESTFPRGKDESGCPAFDDGGLLSTTHAVRPPYRSGFTA